MSDRITSTSTAQQIRLAFGELTASELLLARAVIRYCEAQERAVVSALHQIAGAHPHLSWEDLKSIAQQAVKGKIR